MEFTLKSIFNTSPKEIYLSWLNSEKHSLMTGGEAHISDKINEEFTAWDGYIEGKNLILEPYERIVQSWRTSEFEDGEEDSQIEILLNEVEGGTELTIIHTNVPESGDNYISGWKDFYFTPMQDYFE